MLSNIRTPPFPGRLTTKNTFFTEHLPVAAFETKRIYASAAGLLHIRKGNLSWSNCGDSKNELRETDCLCLCFSAYCFG